jgi:hypothetical protein
MAILQRCCASIHCRIVCSVRFGFLTDASSSRATAVAIEIGDVNMEPEPEPDIEMAVPAPPRAVRIPIPKKVSDKENAYGMRIFAFPLLVT